MSTVRTSLVSGAAVAAAVLTVVAGSVARQRVDSGAAILPISAAREPDLSNLLASVSSDVPEGDFFKEMVRLLKREYVEPIQDEHALAYGAVKGMVLSLGDWESQYYAKDEFAAYQRAMSGEYEGIGAELVFDVEARSRFDGGAILQNEEGGNPAQELPIPRLRVVAVTPGGPAEKAGVLPGDVVETVDGRWVPAPEPMLKLQSLSEKMRNIAKLPPAEADALEQEFRTFAGGLKEKWDHRMSPQKARARLSVGTQGAVSVVWRRGSNRRTTEIAKGLSKMPGFSANADGPIVMAFREGDARRLKEAVAGKREVVIDLRGGGIGSFSEMRSALAAIAPSGTYGFVESVRPSQEHPLVVENGNSDPPAITLLVGRTTRGPAEIFALALAKKGLAKTTGGQMGGERSVIETVALPDGSGYTLVTGEYKTEASKPKTESKKAALKKPTPVASLPSTFITSLGGTV